MWFAFAVLFACLLNLRVLLRLFTLRRFIALSPFEVGTFVSLSLNVLVDTKLSTLGVWGRSLRLFFGPAGVWGRSLLLFLELLDCLGPE